MLFPDWIIFILSILMIGVSALSSTREDVLEAFTGSNQDLFKNRKAQGAEVFFYRAMLIMAILYFIMIIWSNGEDRFFN